MHRLIQVVPCALIRAHIVVSLVYGNQALFL